MFKFYRKCIFQQNKGIIRNVPLAWHNNFASSTAAEANSVTDPSPSADKPKPQVHTKPKKLPKNYNIIQAAFNSIGSDDNSTTIQTPHTDEKIKQAQTVNELLSLTEGSGISRAHALKVVSVLSNWVSSGNVALKDFDSDQRFIRICRVLTKSSPGSRTSKFTTIEARSDDLATVLSVTADEEAAKLVESITVSQMIKVLSTLAAKKRRSVLLLRTLAYNITASSEALDIKQCADLLFSVSSLNFYDENLFDKITSNVISVLETEKIKKSAVVGSILTSLGLLKFRHPGVLDAISEWTVKNHSTCRPQDVFSLFMTLAVLDYSPLNSDTLFKTLNPMLTQEEAGKPLVWLEIVWSLILLNHATTDHIKSVLNETFMKNLESQHGLTPSAILKLLNIDGAAECLIPDYTGPRIRPDHPIRDIKLSLSKEKLEMVHSMVDSLKNLVSSNYLKTEVNTGLGFFIDAECILDKNCNPKPFSEKPSEGFHKIAILTYDYHDMCKGKPGLTGLNVLTQRILKAMQYTIVSVPYTEFKPNDKVVHRVQYLETKIKEAVKST